MPSSLELLYNQIKNTGVAGKDYGEFQNKMADAAYRQNLYKSLTKHGANVGANIGEFEQKLGYGYVAPSNQPAPQPAEQTAPTAQPQKPDGPLTPQDKAEMSNWVNQAQFDTEKQMKQFKEATDATMNISPFGNNKADLIFNKHLRKGNQSFNAETGQFEDTFMTSDGRKFKSQAEASRVQDSLDQFGDYVKYKQNMENLGLADITGEQDKDINKRIEEAYNELENIDVEIDKGRLGQASRMARASGLAGSSALSNDDRLSAQNQDNLLTARRLIERRIKALEAERDDAGFWTGTGNVLTDDSALSFGLSDANDMMALSKIKDKVNSGAPLTNSEKLLARSYLMNQEAQALNNNRDWWYKAGEGFGETLNFMKDFALTGGGFANVAKQGMRMGTKAGLKYGGSDMAKFLTKNLGVSGKVLNKTIQYGAKFGGLAAGAEVGGVALANTVQLPKTMANIAERSMGEMTIDKDGKLAFKDAEDLGKAILYEELKASGENASELVGPAFDLIPGLMGRAIRNKFGGELLKKITSNKFWRGGEKTLDYLGVQSVFGEGMEEEYGMLRTAILNKITGGEMDPNAQDITDLGTQLDTWATVGLTSVLLRAPQIVASGRGQVEHWGYKYNLNQSDQRLKDVFYSPTSIYDAQQYHSVKDMLDNADNKNIGHVINSIVSGGQLTPEQKEAVMYYAQDLINLRGYNIGSVLAASQIDKIMPRTASYQIKGDGKSFDELDQYGNVIAHHEYENADEMKAGLYEAQQNRFDYDLNSDIGVMKIRPDGQYDKFKNDFSFDNEISPEDFDAILEKPSAKRTDAEQQLVQQFAKELHSAVYDNTMLHEEQSAQDGEKAADDASIDMDNPQPTELQEAKAAFMAASGNRRMAFDNNEDLKQEVLRMEEEGLSHQEILSNLESFSTQEQQAVIDYYNQQARYESMVNKVNQKINEEAVVRRNNHTFKGTIDGEADQANVRTITDGTNRYFLVSGNITTDGEGNITGSDSGLIIGMDLDGSFVNIGDTNGYSVEPPTMSLDQYEEAERNNLQVTWTTAIDPDAAEQQEAEVQSNAEGEAGATNGTGANEPSAPSVAPQTEQTQIPVDEKTGVKLYEQGVPVDQAIADLQKDGRDVAAWADLAINEAQEELGKMKQPKTRAELVKNEARVKELQTVIDYYNKVKQRWAEMNAEAQSVEQPQKPTLIKSWQTNKGRKVELFIMPETVDEDGNRHVKIGRSIDGGEISTGHTNGIDVSTGLIDYEATYAGNDEVEERDKEDGTRYIVTEVIYLPDGRILARGTIAGDKASFWLKGDPLAPANSEENANVQLKEPIVQEKPASSQSNAPTVEEQKQQRIAEAKAKYGDLFDDDFTKANDVNELVSMWVGRKRNLAWDDVNGKRGLQKELGWTRKIGGDTKYIETLLAKNGEGVGVDEFVHMVWESPENDVMGEKRWSTEEIKESLLDLLKNAQSKSDVVDFALNNRIAQAEAALQQQQMMEAEAETQQEEIPANEQPINEGGIPFAPATEEEITNSVNENNNVAENNVSLQTENNTSNEQTSMGSPNQEGNGISEEDAGASDVLRRVSIAASETGQGGGSKERLLAQLEESAKDSGYWIDDDISQIDDLKVNVGGENEVYKTEDGKDAIKLNNFAFLRDDATNFEDFINRVESFNDLFPDVALQVIGFAKNSKGEVCVVLQQPWIEAEREATEAEIDDALEELDFYTDITGNWTDGKYEVTDLKPNNVLVDKEGNLHFIDVITFDSSKPGVLMRPKKPVEQKSPKQEQEKKAPTVNQAYAPNEEEYGDIKAWLELHPGASVAEIQRHFKIGYSKATIAKQRFDNEKAARPETDDYLKPRDAEEEKIVEDIHNQLQQEIQAAIGEVNKARFELQKAQAKESDRATDLFGNDNAMNQEGQLFDNSDMPVDQTIEGVERRTSAQREKLQAAQNKLNKLQSAEERNSRIRGALDNKRRQTSFDEIDERHKREYDEYIKPLLNRSDEELQQMAKKIEDSVGGDLKKLEGNKEYSAINLVLLQRKLDREHEDVKVFIQNTIDDGDVSFVDKATVKEFDELNHLINEYGVDDSEGKIEAYVKRLRKKYPVAKSNKPLSEYTLDDFINDARSVLGDNLDWKGIAEWIGHMQTVSKVFALRELKAIFGESWDRIRYIEAANGNYDFGDALSNYIVKKNTEGFNDEPAEQKKSGPLTVEEIDNAEVPKQQKTLAKAYLNGNHGELQTAAYNDIYEEVRGEEVQQETQPQQPTMSKVNVEGLFNDLYTKGETKLSDHAEPVNPMEMIEKKADEFRQEEERKNETPEQKRARLKQEILDKAHKLSEMQKKNVRDDLGKLGMNRLTPSFIPRDKEQRKMFWDLVSTTAEYGYTYIQEGVTNFKEWSKRIYDDVVSTMQDIFGWTQEEVDGYINAVWNSEVEAEGGEAKTLAEFAAEKQNKPNVSDNTVNDNKNVLQGQENNVNLQQKQNNNDNDSERERTPEADRMQREGDSQEGAGGENLNSPTGVSQGEPSGAEATQKGRLDSNIQERGNDRQGNSGVQSGNEQARSSSGRSNRPVQGLNKNNNHEERGTESAPTSTIGRIEANIEAIELMQKLMEEGRPATDEEKKVLRQFSGWGGLGVAFANPVYQNKIRELLGDEGYEQANMSRNSAYYTPAKIIDRLWDIARALGFKGGNVLEGSAGIGKIIGLMPTDLSESSHIQAVEIDETTGNILKLLYPDAQVDIQGFEETKIPNGSVDLAITNVPFVTGLHVKDNSGDGDLSKKFGNIHDFCIAKNIRKLKEGGIGIFITSKGTLDDSQNLREWISAEGNADVVGAFRLNNETFGGTPVTSDIIIVRKRVNGNKSANAIDVALPAAVRTAKYDTGKTKKVKNPETGRKEEVRVYRDMPLDYNGYFIEHPEHMGGEMAYRFEKDLDYQPTSKACFPVEGKNQDALLNAWVKELQTKDWSQEQTVETEEAPVNNYEKYGEGVKEGSLILDSKGNVCIARYGQAVPLDTNDKKVKGQTKQQCLKDYTAIKNALQAVLDYQMNNEGNDGLQPLLDKLNKAYDQFVRKYGHFHGNTAIAFLRNDVDYASVGALETYREKLNADGTKTPVYGKADVFSKRVVEKEKEPQPTTIKDGVIASIYKFGGIDIPYIAKQLGLSEEEAKKQILENELGYENPDTMQVDVSYVYLSGNVREKLQKARDNNVGGKYAKNISALEKVIPADIPAHLIEFNLGSTWIENKLYTDFFQEKTGKKVTCRNLNGGWVIDIPDGWTPKEGDGAVISEMCDKTIYTSQLIAAAMQGKTIKVQKIETRRDPWGNKTSETITDKEATQACAARIEELKAEFKDWARAKMQDDPELSERTEKTYNDRFNNYAMMEIPDEYSPLRYGGQTTTLGKNPFSLLPHQSKAVIKGVTQPVLYAHEVGSGKTFTLITTAMEMRRIGTAKKPMIVVQNATVGQFTESAKQLYPGAKILTMDDDHSEAARKAFYAKIKYNDWDLIIISQSVLDKIPDNPDRQIAFIRQKIDEKEMVLEQLRANKESGLILKQMENEIDEMEDEISGLVEQSRERQEKKRKRDEKKRAVAKQNAAVRAKEQLDRSVDDVDDFDDMDIDAILVDEAHGYKKLGFESVMTRVKGVDTGSSKKCASLFLKTRAVLEKSNGKNVVFATGTPVSNTAAEVWTFMRYLMPPDVMKEYGIYYFDDFARNFGNVQQMLEFTTSGKFKENNRFAGYVNMPELGRIWTSVADIMTNKEVEEGRKERNEESKLPEVEGGKATDLYLPQTKALRSIMKKVRYILEQYENMSGKEKKRNSHIPLVAYGIAKAAAVDARLVDGEAEDDPNSKTNEAVRQTLKSLKETESYKGTVALFADNYQNKHTGFNLYQDIKKKLIEQGVPENQIAIISGSPKLSDKKKLEIFDKVNKGEIRVVLGSTFTLGTGVNIQERLHTLIHIDAPNRPMDYDQRNGRIVRQGNLHKVWGIPVRILRFGVEDSLDVTAYQRLKTKGAIADSVMESKVLAKNAMDSRVLEEEEDVFGDMTAQLSGSEYAMLKNQAEKDVRKLEAKKKQHEADQIFIHAQLPRLKGQNREAEGRIEQYKEALAKVTEASKNGTTIEIGEGKYDSLDAMTEFFTNYNSKIREIENNMRKEGKIATQRRELTVKINGFDIKFTTVIDAGSKLEKGRMVPFTTRNVSYSCDELWGNASFTCKGGYIKNGIEEILNETMTGNDYTEAIETAQNTIERNNQQIKALEERQGRDFTEEDALQKAKDRLEEYTQKMKEEMEAKEAKYKEMDAEVEAAGDLDWDNDDDEEEGNEESPKRMITSHDPMEAINQAAESWREENMPNEIKNFVNGIAERFGLNGAAPTYVINSRDELDAMKGEVSESVFKEIEELYNEPDTGAAYIPRGGIVVVFGEKISDIKEAESTWWHEQAHGYWQTLPKNLRESFGNACLDYLFRHHRTDYNHIINDYPKKDHLNEACSFFVGQLISKHGTEKILGSKFEGIEEICNFANGLINYIKNGREQQERTERDSLRHGRPVGSVGESSEVYGRDTQGRERGDNGLRNEKEEVTDPIQAIEESAKRWRKRRKESVEEAEAVKEYSAKQVYNQRVDTAEFVTTEAYQDAMVGLKTIQNAISKDKEIPDSQNAYQAENLMHGTNYVEQEQFNTEIRATLLAAVNDIIKKTGMSYDDVDRYTITKHGLERNRELFVRDWFAEQRRKPANYNDLTTEEQEAYDKMAARIEEMFEDGEIDSEEKKEIKLNQALKKVHKDYLDKLEKSYVDLKNENFAKVQSGEMTFPQYLEAIDNFIRDHIDERYKAEKHDYSGLTALFGKGYKEADVINTLTETENNIGKDLTDALWERINAASQYGLDRYRQAGMRTDELLDRIENMFHWYVPLRGFKEDTGEDMYQYFTSKGEDVQHFGGLIRSAGGRRSEAFSPLVSLVNMSYKTIIDCNQNSVNQKFYRLCQANPNDVVVLSDSWVELDKNTGEWVQAYPQIDEEATEDEVIKAMADFEAEMKGKEREGTAKRLRGKPSFDYRPADKKKRAEHTVEVYINGQRKLMTVVGNPRAAQALNGLTRFRKADNWVSDFNAVAKNWMSKVSTSYNPTFAARNMMRDWTHFEAILLTREGEGYRRAASGYYHPTHMMSLFNKYRKGTLDESIEEERDFKDFMDNGALTGYTHMQKMEDLQNDMKKQLDKMQKKGKLKIKTDTLFSNALDAVEAWNEAIENAARFATYRASRHYAGRTRQRSAYDAKEVTVNFNRKGAGSRTAGFKSKNKSVMRRAKLAGRSAQLLSEGRMFFNATLQAVATIFKNFKNPDGSWNWKYIRRFSTRYALPPFAAAYMLPAINMALIMLAGGGDGDDPYANLPEWVRRKNLCLYLGWIPGLENKVFGTQYSKFMYNNFLTIPIGQELAAFFSLGDLAASMTYAPNIRPVDFDLFNEFVSFINVFSPVDLDTKVTERDGWDRLPVELVARVSTVLAPIVAVEENVSWTGRTIYREDKFEGDKDIPEYQMVYNNTNGGFVWISKGLNRIGGGTDVERGDILGVSTELNPGALQYLVEQYTGGPGKLATNTGSAIHDAWDWIVNSGEDANFNIRKIEIAKAFLQQADDNTQFYRIKTKYRLYKDDADKLYRTINSYAKDAAENPDHYMRIEELTKGEDFARMRIIKSTEADMKRLNDAIYSSKGEQRKQLQSMYNSAMKGIVEELDSVGKE